VTGHIIDFRANTGQKKPKRPILAISRAVWEQIPGDSGTCPMTLGM
jgi:hypothetical protein